VRPVEMRGDATGPLVFHSVPYLHLR
jgi:hypothetical protein